MKYLSLVALLVVCTLGFTGCMDKIGSWCGVCSSKTETVADDSMATDDSSETSDVDMADVDVDSSADDSDESTDS